MATNYDDLIAAAAKQYQVDPALVRAVVYTESSGNPDAVSDKGAAGLGQLMPETAKSLGVKNPKDPRQAIPAIAKLLDENLTRYGNVEDALRAYHGGTNTQNWGPKTQAYPAKVLAQVSGPKTLPGIPSAAGDPSDDDIFRSFIGNPVQPGTSTSAGNAAGTSQNGDDAIFQSFMGSGSSGTENAPHTSESRAPDGTLVLSMGGTTPPEPKSATVEAIEALGRGTKNLVRGINQGLTDLPAGIGQEAVHTGSKILNDIGLGSPAVAAQVAARDAEIAQRETGYQDATPGSIAAGIGRLAGNAMPLVAGGGGVAAPITRGAELGEQLMKFAPSLGRLAGASAGSAIQGAGLGAVSPVTSGDYASGQGGNINMGTILGGAAPVVGAGVQGAGRYIGNVLHSLADPFTQPGQERMATNVLARSAAGAPMDANTAQIVPGSVPTLAEATGNPGIATLQRTIRDIAPNDFVAREQANAAARVAAASKATGGAEDLAQATAARMQATNDAANAVRAVQAPITSDLQKALSRPAVAPVLRQAEQAAQNAGGVSPFAAARQEAATQRATEFGRIAGTPEDVTAARTAMNDAVGDLYKQAKFSDLIVDKPLKSILDRPAMKTALKRAQALADEQDAGPIFKSVETGQALSGVGVPAKTTQYIGGTGLHYVKMALDDMASGRGTQGIAANEKNAILGSQKDLLGWFEQRAPEYKEARQLYAQYSKPIDAMEYLQGLNLTDAQGSIVPGKLDSAIKGIEAQRAEKGIHAAKSITDDQLSALRSLRSAVNEDRAAVVPANLGPEGVAHVQASLLDLLNSSKSASLPPKDLAALRRAQESIVNWASPQNPSIGSAVDAATAAANHERGLAALQGFNLTDTNGNVTAAKVESALRSLQAQKGPVDPARVEALRAVREDLRRAGNASLGRSAGSSTAQNLATQNMMATMLPGHLGALASKIPPGGVGGALGTGLGYLAGGPAGAVMGGVAGSAAGKTASGLMSAKNEAVQSALAQLLLNSDAGLAALQRAAAAQTPLTQVGPLQRLLYPSLTAGAVGGLSRLGIPKENTKRP
jgi:hypothetical protein